MSDEHLIEAVTRAFASGKERIATRVRLRVRLIRCMKLLFLEILLLLLFSAVQNLTKQVAITQSKMNEFKSVNRREIITNTIVVK